MNTRASRYYLLVLILLLTMNSAPAMANDFRLSADGVGPIVVSMQINVRNAKEELTAFPRKVAELTASARNDSGQPIRYAKFCVQAARRTKGCDFQLWTNEVWEPGEELVWTIDGHARRGIEKATIMLVKLKKDVQKPALRSSR